MNLLLLFIAADAEAENKLMRQSAGSWQSAIMAAKRQMARANTNSNKIFHLKNRTAILLSVAGLFFTSLNDNINKIYFMTQTKTVPVITHEALLDHWQGHRGLTRRMIEAFPEDKLFTYSIGGMRTFSQLVQEFLSMAVPTVHGIATGKWESYKEKPTPSTKKDLLKLWDEDTQEINRIFPTIPPHRFQEVDKAFGQWEGTGQWILFYIIDNEIHHRGQAYVYLRSLGIEPPAFWDRS